MNNKNEEELEDQNSLDVSEQNRDQIQNMNQLQYQKNMQNMQDPFQLQRQKSYEEIEKRNLFIQQYVQQANKPAISRIETEIKQLNEQIKQNINEKEKIVDFRIKQLSLTKLLVMVYDKSEESLVNANYNLGVAYLDFKSYESSLYHLTLAQFHQNKLDNTNGQTEKSKQIMPNILIQLAKCFLEIDNLEDCLESANQSLQYYSIDSLESVQALYCKYKCYLKKKNYEEAQKIIDNIFDIQTKNQTKRDEKAEQIAISMTNVEKAKVWFLLENYLNSIEDQSKAIQTLIEQEYDDPDYVAGLLVTLSKYQQKANKIDDQIDSLQKVKCIYNSVYGFKDIRLIKVMRQLSMILLNNRFYEETINELKELKKAECQVFGEKSIEVGLTLRIIAIGSILSNRQEKEFKDEIKKNYKESKDILDNNRLKDLRPIKIMRQLSMILLSNNYNEDAINELKELKVYILEESFCQLFSWLTQSNMAFQHNFTFNYYSESIYYNNLISSLKCYQEEVGLIQTKYKLLSYNLTQSVKRSLDQFIQFNQKAECQAFGEFSLEVGKTLKNIGIVQIFLNCQDKEFKDDIKKTLSDANEIFKKNKQKKTQIEQLENLIKMVEDGEIFKKKQTQNVLKQMLENQNQIQ